MQSSINVFIIEEKLDICKLMADPIQGATEVDDRLQSQKLSQRKCPTWALEKYRCAVEAR